MAAAAAPGPADSPDTGMGALALEQGWISDDQLAEALAIQAEDARDGRPRRPLGAILVSRKLITAQQLAALLKVQQTLRKGDPREVIPEEVQPASLDPRNWFGKYVRVEPLGAGGMADVYRAWDPELRRWVALKVLRGRGAADLRRFLNEARAAARLSHPGIVPVYDFGEENGQRFIAMPCLKGKTLDERRPDAREAARFLRDAARAVSAAHRAGVLHRDIKPQNLLVDDDGAVHVMDFGLAREIHADSSVTLPGTILGTPHYAPPEQLEGALNRIDARSDVYSLGATLYEALTGRAPHDGPTLTDLIQRAIRNDPVPPRHLKPDVPVELQWICLRAMSKDAARRYATADEFADDLQRFLDGKPVLARRPSILYRTRRALLRRPALAAVAGVLLLSLLAAGILLLAVRRREEAFRLLSDGRDRLDAALEMQRAAERAPEEIVRALAAAAQRLDESIRLRPAAEAFVLRGRIRTEQMRLDEAEGDFTRAIDGDPAARIWRARLYALRLRFAGHGLRGPDAQRREAERWSRLAREDLQRLPPDAGGGDLRVRAILDAMAAALVYDDVDDALAAIREAGASVLDEDLLVEQGALELKAGHLEEAEATLTTALRMRPHFVRARLLRGIDRRDRGDAGAAEEDFSAAAALAPDFALPPFALSNLKQQRGDHAGAIPDLERALELDPTIAAAHNNLGVARMRLGDSAAAMREYAEAIRLDPGWADPYFNRGEARRTGGDLRAAIADYDEAIRRDPEHAMAFYARALARAALGEPADTDLDEAVRLRPENADYRFARGRARQVGGDPAGAIEDYDAAVAARPTMVEAIQNRGVAHQALGEEADAAADFEEVTRLQPDNATAHALFADSLALLGDPARAIGEYGRALAIRPDYPEALSNRGILRARANDVDGGIEDLRAALQCAPPDWPIRDRVEAILRSLERDADPDF